MSVFRTNNRKVLSKGQSLRSFNSLTDAFISPLVYVSNSSLQLELKYFFLQLLNVKFMEYLDNCSCTVQFAQKTTDVWLITHLGMPNKEVRVNRWIYKCVCVCVCVCPCVSLREHQSALSVILRTETKAAAARILRDAVDCVFWGLGMWWQNIIYRQYEKCWRRYLQVSIKYESWDVTLNFLTVTSLCLKK